MERSERKKAFKNGAVYTVQLLAEKLNRTFSSKRSHRFVVAPYQKLSGGTTVPDEIYERQCALIPEETLFFPLETEKTCWKMWGSVGNLKAEK